MALTSYPTIVFNSVSGSNDFASGDNVTSAIIGTATATTSTTVTLSITSGSLSTVPQNGSAVLYMSGVGFTRIGSHNGSDTLTVEAVISGNSVPFAIGGKRATIDHLGSRRLFAGYSHPASGNIAGAGALWNIYAEDSPALTLTSGLTINVIPTGNSPGDLTIYGGSGVNGSRLVWLQTAGQPHIHISGTLQTQFKNIDFQITGTPKAVFIFGAAPTLLLDNCSIGNTGGINNPTSIYVRGTNGGYPHFTAINSHFIGLASGVTNGTASALSSFNLFNCEFSKCATDVLLGMSTTPVYIYKSLISHNSGNVFSCSLSSRNAIIIIDSTFDNNRGAVIRKNINDMRDGNTFIINSQFTNNIIGLFYTTTSSGGGIQRATIENCNFFNNTSGNVSGLNTPTLSSTNTFLDPQYIDNSRDVRNYGVGTVMRRAGYVTGMVGNSDNQTISYGVIGVAQRDESTPASGGETSYIFG